MARIVGPSDAVAGTTSRMGPLDTCLSGSMKVGEAMPASPPAHGHMSRPDAVTCAAIGLVVEEPGGPEHPARTTIAKTTTDAAIDRPAMVLGRSQMRGRFQEMPLTTKADGDLDLVNHASHRVRHRSIHARRSASPYAIRAERAVVTVAGAPP
jgi:hypothetical protein